MTEDPPPPAGNDPAIFPGVTFAYDFVQPSYDRMIQRVEALETRIRAFLAIGTGLLFAAPVLVKAVNSGADLKTIWFGAAVVLLLAALGCGVAAHIGTTLIIISPQVIYDKWLAMDEWHFKHTAIYWAADAFPKNAARVNRAGYFADAVGVLIILGAASLIIWAFTQTS